MIANRGYGRWRGKASFGACVDYVLRLGEVEGPLAAWSSGVASVGTAPFEMEALAAQSKVVDPVYHVILSWGPDERPSLERIRTAVDAQLEALGLAGLQTIGAVHEDGVGGMVHAHVVVNRVDPLTERARPIWRDRVVMRETCRGFERDDGWRVVGDENADSTCGVWGGEREASGRDSSGDGSKNAVGSDSGARIGTNGADAYGARAKFRTWVRENVRPGLEDILRRSDATWERVVDFLAADQLRYEVVSGVGARVVGTLSGWAVKLSEIGMKHRDFVDRLGTWLGEQASTRERRDADLAEKVSQARDLVEGISRDGGWPAVHESLRALGLGIEKRINGARIVDLDGPGWQRIDRNDPVLSLRSMRERFGPYASSEDEQHREKLREIVRRAENLVVAEQLSKDPSPIYTTLFQTKVAVGFEDLQRDIDRRVVDAEQREKVLRAAVQGLLAIELGGQTLLTTARVVSEERSAMRSARDLAAGHLSRDIRRPASERLDAQQRVAYEYATAREGRLKVITGVPGSGKTALLREVAAGYESAGFRVRGVAVANSAVDVLRRETSISARSVAKELYELRRDGNAHDRTRLSSHDVVLIDEVSTLGTEQGGALLAEAARVGATIVALGDDKQFQSVARGDALRIMQQAVGDRSVDLTQTRRQRQEWQREATHAVRRGDVRSALEAYRERGCIRESKTQSEARAALITRWSELERQGVEVGIETYTNKERVQLNAAARSAYRALGRLTGPDVALDTMDGRTSFAVGERVAVRETLRGAGLFNGSVATVREIRGAVLDVERRDGVVVSIDTREHPGVQHGYASTEFREQGSTRYAELQMLTRQVNQRSLTVGMTRHTDEFSAFYSREEFRRGFAGVVQLGERSQQKALVLDGIERGQAQDVLSDRLERELSRERALEIAG